VLKHSAFFFSFVAVTTILNILFRKYVSSSLEIDDFGVFTAILALYGMMIAPVSVFPMYLARNMAILQEKRGIADALSFRKKFLRIYILLIVVIAALLVLFSPLWKDGYHLYSVFPVLLAIGLFFLQTLSGINGASLQSFQDFGTVGKLQLICTSVKLLSVIVFFEIVVSSFNLEYYISKYNFVIFSAIIGAFVAVAAGFFILSRKSASYRDSLFDYKIDYRSLFHDLWPMAVLLLLFGVLNGIDEFFARHYLDKNSNGLYGSIVTLGKTSIYIIASVIYVVFPKLSSNIDDPLVTRRIMLKALVLSLASFAAVMMAVLLFSDFILELLTHKKYLAAAPYLKLFFIAYMPYSLIFMLINFFIIHKNLFYIIGLTVIVALEVMLYSIFHGSINEIIYVMGLMGYVNLLFSSGIWYMKHARLKR